MAKAKKSETAAAPEKSAAPKAEAAAAKAAPAKAPAAKAPAAKKKAAAPAAAAKKPAATAQASGVPMIDTNLAAESAAKMLVNRDLTAGAAQGENRQETSTFKNLKEQLAKPKSSALSSLLGSGTGQKKGGGHNAFNQMKGHNQTRNAFNKTGVPRRTNG